MHRRSGPTCSRSRSTAATATTSSSGSLGDDLVIGGRGNDTLLGGSGNDTFVWNPGDGSDIIEGQGGSDTLQFNGANIAEKIDISANGSRVRFTRDVAAITMDVNGVETINFTALGGSDNITVGDLKGTNTTQVNLDLSGDARQRRPVTAPLDHVIGHRHRRQRPDPGCRGRLFGPRSSDWRHW